MLDEEDKLTIRCVIIHLKSSTIKKTKKCNPKMWSITSGKRLLGLRHHPFREMAVTRRRELSSWQLVCTAAAAVATWMCNWADGEHQIHQKDISYLAQTEKRVLKAKIFGLLAQIVNNKLSMYQCDQMAKLFVQCLTNYNIENFPKRNRSLTKKFLNFSQYLLNPQKWPDF